MIFAQSFLDFAVDPDIFTLFFLMILPLFYDYPGHSRETKLSAAMHRPDRQLSRHLYHDINFDHIVFLKIVEALEYKTALVACVDFLHVVLETL